MEDAMALLVLLAFLGAAALSAWLAVTIAERL